MFRNTKSAEATEVTEAPRRRRITSAHVVAGVALFAALGGTSYAASSLKANSVGSAQVKNNSLKSSDIKNGSLLKKDFKTGELPGGTQGPKGDKGDPGSDAVPNVSLSDLSAATTTSSTTPTTIAGLTQNITIPGGAPRKIVANVTGESACYGGTGYCSLRILVDGAELTPNVGSDFAFNSTDNNTETSSSWESLGLQRYSDTLAPGAHTVTVQHYAVGTATHRFDDAALVVTQVQG
ncbi:hypothetical protein PAI11_37980 [Patulibacter medicamentivorans]|uniref:Uncharacterized protein n=1 Tax=Patulibacter medicamentivorans TaxID=1097667 RepID=H0EAC4_9ACTN|nr:hypothetical protein [Patulibacter medicamentivorans]EHN09378.1 hypothetical protein PAI11_37980 [Patulibacter medicamentivorans]